MPQSPAKVTIKVADLSDDNLNRLESWFRSHGYSAYSHELQVIWQEQSIRRVTSVYKEFA